MLENVSYKLKPIRFLGRSVPIVLQNENGPCPLLAIANVLLLRNSVKLRDDFPEIGQGELIQLVADWLLDANSPQRLGHNADNRDYMANLEQNVADAINLLPKLCTGVDVNVRFNSIKGFEFTEEVAIFDLLDISLVHGWIVDPTDPAAQALGDKSYNEIAETLATTLGDETAYRLLTPASSCSFRSSGSMHLFSGSGHAPTPSSPFRTSSGAVPKPSEDAAPGPSGQPTLAPPPQPLIPVQSLMDAPMDVPEPSQAALDGPLADWALAQPDSSMQAANLPPPAAPDASLAGVSADGLQYADAMDLDEETAAELQAALLLSMGDSAAPGAPLEAMVPVPVSAAGPPRVAGAAGPPGGAPGPKGGTVGPGDVPAEGKGTPEAVPASIPMERVEMGGGPRALPEERADGAGMGGAGAALPGVHGVGTGGTGSPEGLPSHHAPPQRHEGGAGIDLASQAAELPISSTSDDSSTVRQVGPTAVQTPGGAAGSAPAPGSAEAEPAVVPAAVHTAVPAAPTADAALIIPAVEEPGSAPSGVAAPAAVGLRDETAPLLGHGPGDLVIPQSTVGVLGGPGRDSTAAQEAPSVVPGPAPVPASLASWETDAAAGREPLGLSGGTAGVVQQDAAGQEPLALSDGTASTVRQDAAGPCLGEVQHVPHVASETSPGDATLEDATLSTKQERSGDGFGSSGGLAADAELRAVPAGASDQSLHEREAAAAESGSSKCEEIVQQIVREILDRVIDQDARGLEAVSGVPECTALPSAGPVPPQAPSAGGSGGSGQRTDPVKRKREMEEALQIQAFLLRAASQLTEQGLILLHEGLRERELAVFFRNNHFSTIFRIDGRLMMLVTDQGYQYEKGVVWECLDNVQGDTYFCTENFIPFTPEQRSSPAASAPALQTNGRVPSAADTTEYVPPGPPLTDVQRAALLAEVALSGVLPREPQPSVDADYALALQLAQEDEQAHVREVLLARAREEQQQQQQQQQRREPARASPYAAQPPYAGGGRGGGGRHGPAGPRGGRGGRGHHQGNGRGTGENCSIM